MFSLRAGSAIALGCQSCALKELHCRLNLVGPRTKQTARLAAEAERWPGNDSNHAMFVKRF